MSNDQDKTRDENPQREDGAKQTVSTEGADGGRAERAGGRKTAKADMDARDSKASVNAASQAGQAPKAGAASRVSVWLLLGGAVVIAVLVFASWMIGGSRVPDYVGYPLEGEQKELVISQNSPLTDYVYLTANADFPREKPISKITIHHMAGDSGLRGIGDRFARRDVQASSNYAIDSDGNVALYVEEANRAWTSKNRENDEESITIEVANDEIGGDWHVSDKAFDKLVDLCVDICERNGIETIDYTGDATGNLTYHGMFDKNTACPGPYLKSRMEDLAAAITARLAE